MIQNISLASQDRSLFELGRKQWACLDALAEHYKNADMSRISSTSKFHDDHWNSLGQNMYNFRWNEWGKDINAFPLMLICKVVSYHAIQVNGTAVSTTQIGIVGFLNAFLETLQSKSICIAERNQPFNPLSYLTSNDITLMAEVNVSSNGKLSGAPFGGINRIRTTSLAAFPDTEFLITDMSVPWTDQGLAYQDWTRQQKQNKGIDTKTKSYPPLKFEVVSSLVKHAMPFITDDFDTVVGVFDEIEKFHKVNPPDKRSKINLEVTPIILKKYGKALENILPIEVYELGLYEGLIKLSWFKKLEQLAQGAAAWIILLTTGLRNSDMRSLEKRCCQRSKRHDLLYYLVTDLKKVDIRNYVLPVPKHTNQAVKLVELAKADRQGNLLFTKSTSTKKAGRAENKRRMVEGTTFNSVIKKFANQYDISLDTILDDSEEATAHCVRATLAGYIGTNSSAAILILKKLFGHSNALMPDAYLSHNPLIIAERNRNIAENMETLSDDMANGMVSGKLSGVKGRQMLQGAEHFKNELLSENKSITQMDMQVKLKERCKEMLLGRIKANAVYALKTPMGVVCMRNCSDSSDTPCAKTKYNEERKENQFSKEISDALATLPNPSQCVGKECSDALFGEAWSRDLLETFKFYVKYLKAVGHNSIDVKHEAELFIKNYGSIMKDIYPDEIEGFENE